MGKVRRPDGVIKGESVVPLSEGISEGMTLRGVSTLRVKKNNQIMRSQMPLNPQQALPGNRSEVEG